MIETIEAGFPKVVGLQAERKATRRGLQVISCPTVDATLDEEKIRSPLGPIRGFPRWNWRAAWDDFKFGLRHYSTLRGLRWWATGKWEAWMATLCNKYLAGVDSEALNKGSVLFDLYKVWRDANKVGFNRVDLEKLVERAGEHASQVSR